MSDSERSCDDGRRSPEPQKRHGHGPFLIRRRDLGLGFEWGPGSIEILGKGEAMRCKEAVAEIEVGEEVRGEDERMGG